jgi:DNA-binding winged helix-turn-helix (wHTH) protein/tetratricopeptide (TPR) repeat protein
MKLFQSFRLDTLNHCVWRGGTRVPLTPKAFDLLRYLVEHSGRVVSQNEILEALWPETYVNPEVIKKYILSIRRVLGDSAEEPVFIETIPRRGYRFVAQVTDEAGTAPPPPSETDAKTNVVGREAVIAELERHLAKALAGQRQVIFVTGEAGIGKTTVVDLFHQRSARHENLRIVRGQCVEGFGGKEAYYPMLEALSQLIRDRDDGPIFDNLAKRAPTWLIQFPALVKPEQREALEREIRGASRERMVREICEALEALTLDSPLMIVLEDLHWVDPSTLDLISALARRREGAKLLLLCTYRPVDVILSQSQLKGLKQDLQVHRLCREIALDRLNESDVADYLRREFQNSNFPDGLAGLVCRQSGGHALFMTAIVQELVNKGFIAQKAGKWKLTQSLQDVDPGVPETLQQMLELQFDHLSPTEQRILKSASVFGDRFSVWAIGATLENAESEIEAFCEGLAEREQFIESAGMQEIGEVGVSAHYEFRHSLYRQVVYRSLSEVSRSRMHHLLGERLKLLCTPGRQEIASEVAMHFERARDHDQAIHYLVIAAENAGKRFAYRESIHILQHALELLRQLDSKRLIEIELRILELIGDTYYYLGEMSQAARTYETQAVRAAEAKLKAAELNAIEHLVMPLGFIDPDRGISFAERAVELSANLNDPILLARAQMLAAGYRCVYETWSDEDWELWSSANKTLCQVSESPLPPYHQSLCSYLLVLRGEYEEASKLLVAQPSSPINETVSFMTHFFTVSTKTLLLLRSGRLGELLQLVTEGRELAAKNSNDPWLFVFREAWLRTLVFDFEGARRLCDSVISSTTVYPTAQPRTIARIAHGYAELERGKYEEAIECFTNVLDPKKTPKFFLHWLWRMTAQLGLSDAWLQAGNLVNARLHADAFLGSALSTADPNVRALGWELQARIAMAEQNRSSAEQAIKKGLEILEAFEVPMAAWRLHATAWDFYRNAINKDTADHHLECSASWILRIADSFPLTEPLRETFLATAPVQRIIESAPGRSQVQEPRG